MRCAIWYHLYNFKNVKNTHGGVLLKVTLLHGCFSRFSNCANGTKSRKASHMCSGNLEMRKKEKIVKNKGSLFVSTVCSSRVKLCTRIAATT